MTIAELIKLLKEVEFGASGRSREISIVIEDGEDTFLSNPAIYIDSTGDGVAGAEITLRIS